MCAIERPGAGGDHSDVRAERVRECNRDDNRDDNREHERDAGVSGALIIGRQNRLMESFERAEALSPVAARTLEQLGCRESFVFQRMVGQGVFRCVDDEHWWMDAEAAADFVHRRHRKILIILGLGLLAAALLAAD